jgi:16S rRNA (guanine527-N7)-methyltransferase
MAVPESRMQELLLPYLGGFSPNTKLLAQIGRYLDLIVQWNARTNLTAVREPEAILQRQIGESLFAAQFVPETGSLLDFGSGAGLPGIPISLLRPGLVITLAESQGKKASFLREASRSLSLPFSVWAGRVETLPASQTFDCVTMRAVDDSERMLPLATERISQNGMLLRFLGENTPAEMDGWKETASAPVPNSRGRVQVLKRP